MSDFAYNDKLYLRMKVILTGLYVEENITFQVNGAENMQFVLHSTGSDESIGSNGMSVLGVFTLEAKFEKTNEQIKNLSRLIENGEVQTNENGIINSSLLPDETKDFLMKLATSCTASIGKFAGFLAWKSGCNISLTFQLKERLHFSFDERIWHMQPLNMMMPPAEWLESFIPRNLNQFSEATYSEDSDDYIEPLYHELARGAITQMSSDIRSSLIMGWIALESGTKDLIAYAIPKSSWIIGNMPSPNIHKILKDFLPSIDLINPNAGRFRLPSTWLTRIQRHMQIRNDLVHGKKIEINRDELNLFLKQVKDILYLIDYHKGKEWSRELISEELRATIVANT